jgi:cobalt-zinc-cadmium resistance protein CzcA
MIKALIDTSLNNRLLVLMLTGLLIAGGLRAFHQLPVDAVPDLTNVQVQVLTKLPGLAPAEVEKFVTFPIEQAMAGIPKLKQVRSLSQFGLSFVTVVFEEGTDIYWARRQISQRLAVAREDIPKGMGTPLMGPLSTGLGEIYQFELKSKQHTAMQLRSILDWYVAPPLRLVKGVVEVNSFGGKLKTFEVQLDSKKLQQYRLTVGEIYHALSSGHLNVGGGYITKAGEQYIVRGEGLLKTRQDIEAIPIKTAAHGTPIYIRNVAKVRFAPMIRQGAVTRDGRGEAVTGTVMMLQGANAAFVIQRVKRKLEELKAGLPKGVQIDVFYDRSKLVQRTLRTVSTNLIEGGLLVIVILFLLLGNLRGGLLVAATIPLSMLFAFICMRWAGISGNLMSLGAIDFGIIVDGSVVIVEHIVLAFGLRQITENSSPIERIRAASHEVARPILFSVIIIMIVYLPILTLQGTEGKLFRPMAWVLLFALGGALLLSLTLMPVLASYVFRKPLEERETYLMRFFRWMYQPLLTLALRFRYSTMGIAAGAFALGVWLLFGMGANFIPKLDEGMIALQANRLPSVSLEESIRHTTRIERVLKQVPEVISVISKTGRAEVATDPMGVFFSDIFVTLQPKRKWREGLTPQRLVTEMKEKLKKQSPANNYSFSQPIALRTAELLSGVRADVALKIFGDDLKALPKSAEAIARILRKIRGAGDVIVEPSIGLPYLRIVLNRREISRHGISDSQVLDTIKAIGGTTVGMIFEKEKRFALRVRFRKKDRQRLAAIRRLPIRTARGTTLPLAQLAHIWFEEGPLQIQREQGRRRVTVQLNVRGRDLASFVAEAKARVRKAIQEKKIPFPEGSFITWGGQFEQLESASKRLLIVVPLALLLIFMLLQMTFGSVRLSLLIYLNVPMAVSGGIFALKLRGMPLSISAAVGFIALSGIAVMNGVLLISAIRHLQEAGSPRRQAIWDGAMERLRPVLMTALTDAIGFLPMAISTSAGAEVQRPLATVVIGGILTSTTLTLLVLPAVYSRWGAETAPPLEFSEPEIPMQVESEEAKDDEADAQEVSPESL